ncbi:MAG: amidase family protein, partial [Pseudomonadales bacterium]|nr:amidase family protein [Pseudomonadales bacterium]
MPLDHALKLCRDLQRGDQSAVDVMQQTYTRINEINPQVNALVNLLDPDEALALAQQADAVPVAERGPLHGLPMATKDAVDVAGFPTTKGFAPWAKKIARKDDAQAARLRNAGALFIGHTNMPEFGLGSNTFNSLFGQTLNPYDLNKTCGGSSGGAAVALATRMLVLADGSDMGGSLRNPASFCNVVGLRPSIGRTPKGDGFGWLGRLTTTGPMATNVADTALLFSVQAGPDPTDPLTLNEPGEVFLDALQPRQDLNGLRIGYCPSIGDAPVEPAVAAVIAKAADTMANLGAEVIETHPPLDQAMGVFQVMRAAALANLGHALNLTMPDWKTKAKSTAVWNIEKGLALSAADIYAAELRRTRIYADCVEFFSSFDALILPAAQVAPFDKDIEWIEAINETPM